MRTGPGNGAGLSIMWIKILEKCRAGGTGLAAGDVVKMDDAIGMALARMGRAIPVEAPKPRPKKKKVSEE